MQGVNVRQRARDIVALLTDDRRLQEEREKAAKNQNKYKGMSSGSMGYGGGGGGGGYGSNSSSYDNYGGSSGRSGGFGNSSSFSSSREAGGTTSSPPSISPRPAPAAPAVGLVGVPEEGALDPVEATRRRIAALKAQGALPDGGSGAGSGGGAVEEGGAGLDSPKRPKKKLSDVKVNPAISAALGKTGLLSPPMPGAGSAAGKPAAAGAGTPSAFDLLGDLEGPTPAPAAEAAGAAAKDDDWDAFTAAPGTSSSAAHSQPAAAPAAAAGSDWAAFTSAPAAPAAAPAKVRPLRKQMGRGRPRQGGHLIMYCHACARWCTPWFAGSGWSCALHRIHCTWLPCCTFWHAAVLPKATSGSYPSSRGNP